jgi:hypothetical protein
VLFEVSLLGLGFVSVLGSTALVLNAQRDLHAAIYWTILDHSETHVFWAHAGHMTLDFVISCLPLFVGSWLGFPLWSDKPRERNAILGWLAVSVVGVAAGGRFYSHYYIQLILPLALFAAPWFKQIWLETIQPRRVLFGYLAATIGVFAFIHWHGLLPLREPNSVAQYLTAHAAPEERIFVWGHAPDIYLDAAERPASRYILTFPLTGYVFGSNARQTDLRRPILPGAWSNLKKDFARHPPEFIVDTESSRKAEFPVRDFPILQTLLDQHYRFVARADGNRIYQRR